MKNSKYAMILICNLNENNNLKIKVTVLNEWLEISFDNKFQLENVSKEIKIIEIYINF
jgi:hypothetical protein